MINKKKLNQTGFGYVGVLLIVVLLIVLVFGGYYVWNNNHNKQSPVVKTTNTSSTPINSPSGSNVIVYTSWSGIPTTVQSYITAIAGLENGSTNPTQIVSQCVEPYVSTTYAVYIEKDYKFLEFSCIGPGPTLHYIGALINGKWNLVSASEGANLPDCTTLNKYNVPIDILKQSNAFVQTSSNVYQCTTNGTTPQTYNGPSTG